MINNLRELNNKINDFVNYVVKTACEQTTSGNYFVSVEDAYKSAGMGYEDFLQYKELIMSELYSREEILDLEYAENSLEIDVNCALNYCPNYEWVKGDEAVFGSYEEFEKREILPVAQPLGDSLMARIGVDAISYVAYKEEKELEDVVKNSLGLSDDIADAVIEAVEAREHEVVAKLEAEILNLDASLKAQGSSEPARVGLKDIKDLDVYFYLSCNDIHTPDTFYKDFESAFSAFEQFCADKLDDSYGATVGIMYHPGQADAKDCMIYHNNRGWKEPTLHLLSEKELGVPEIALAAYKAYQKKYPFEEKTQRRIDALEKKLGVYERGVDVSNDFKVGKWRVHLVPTGGHYGLNNNLVNTDERTLLEFYDMSVDIQRFPFGQFVSRYDVNTLVSDTFGPSPSLLMQHGLCLDGSNAGAWSVSGEEMTEIYKWLDKQPLKDCDKAKPSLSSYIDAAEERKIFERASRDFKKSLDGPEL